MKLLVDERPLPLLPTLAKRIGLHEAIFLQQLHFRLLISKQERDGYKWCCKTIPEWQQEFPYISYETMKRVITRLEKGGYIVTSNKYNRSKLDKTKWYRIHYDKIYREHPVSMDRATCLNG